MNPEIVIKHIANSTLAGREQRFAKSPVSVGRADTCDVIFDAQKDTIISHRHAEIAYQDDRLVIRDLGSRNGTYVNQQRITGPTEVSPSDVIAFGGNGPTAQVVLDFSDATPTLAAPGGRAAATMAMAAVAPSARRATGTAAAAAAAAVAADEGDEHGGEGGMGLSTLRWVIDQSMRKHTSGRSTAWSLLLLMLLAGFGGGVAVGHFYTPKSSTPLIGQDASGASEFLPADAISCLGRLEPAGGLIEIAATPGAVVSELNVGEGDELEKDGVIAYLQGFKEAEAQVAAAEAEASDADLLSQRVKAYGNTLFEEAQQGVEASKPEVTKNQTEAMKVKVAIAQKDQQVADHVVKYPPTQSPYGDMPGRLQLILDKARDGVSAVQWEQAQLTDSVRLKRQLADAQLRRAQAERDQAIAKVNPETARKKVEIARATRDRMIVKAPVRGQVLKVHVHQGEAAANRPILEMGDTDAFQVIAEVFQDNLQRVKEGQAVEIRSPAFPTGSGKLSETSRRQGVLHGKVAKLLWTIKRSSLRDLNPVASEDLRVVNVQVDIDEADGKEHRDLLARLVNIEADVLIRTTSDASKLEGTPEPTAADAKGDSK